VVEYRWRTAKIITFILKFCLVFLRKIRRENYEQREILRLIYFFKYLLIKITDFRFETMLSSLLGNENSDVKPY